MRAAKLIAVFLAIAVLQLSWHWLLSGSSSFARTLARLYLAYDPHLGKGVAPILDVFLPSIWLGLLTGFISWDWPVRKMIGFVIAFSVGLACMLPAYAYLVGPAQVWWWPQTRPDLLVMFIGKGAQALLTVSFFTYAGRYCGAYHNAQTNQELA